MSTSKTAIQRTKKVTSGNNLVNLKNCINNLEVHKIDEIICEEASAVFKNLENLNFDSNQEFTINIFQDRVKAFEDTVQTLTKMSFLLGQWGRGQEYHRLVHLVNQLLRQGENKNIGGGKVNWIYLDNYPLILLITAYCLGLTYSQRWSELYDFLNINLSRIGITDSLRIVDFLTIYTWEGLSIPIWHELPQSIEKSQFSLELYVESVFKVWISDGAEDTTDFYKLFGQLGILTAIVYMEKLDIAQFPIYE